MEAEGVVFHCNAHVGKDVSAKELEEKHDALLLAGGSEQPFDFFAKSPGRDLDGLVFAMTFLPQQNRRVSGEPQKDEPQIMAEGKHVIVIGGGDTGSDCIGTSFRQGAKSVTQLEIMPMPPQKENKALSWPHWPLKLRVSSSQAEGANVEYSISTTGFAGQQRQGREAALHARRQRPEAGARQRGRAARRPRAVRHGLLRPGGDGRGAASWASASSRAGASRASTPTTATTASRAARRRSRRATSAAARASWCGRSARAARPPTPSTSS